MKIAILILMGLSFLTGCSPTDFKSQSELGDLTVIALVADKPEADAGQTVTITPLVSDYHGGGRALTYSAEACIDPNRAYGKDVTCENAVGRQTIATDAALTGLSGPDYTGLTGSFSVTLPPAALIYALRTTADQYNGIAYYVIFEVKAADGTKLKAFRRILVSTRTQKNLNPTITSFKKGGETLSALPTEAAELTPNLNDDVAEAYLTMRSNGTNYSSVEEIRVDWYATSGKLQASSSKHTDKMLYTPPDTRPGGHGIILVGVARDGRGGVGTVVLNLQ